jgi:replicative DNA helicase
MPDSFFEELPPGYWDTIEETNTNKNSPIPVKTAPKSAAKVTQPKPEQKPVQREARPVETSITGTVIPGQIPPPQAVEVEAALIGCLLVNRDVFPLVAGNLTVDDFYDHRHNQIWSVIANLFQENVIVDPITVANVLKSQKQLQSIGGVEYLSELVSMSVPSEGAEHYAKIIRDHAVLRRMITTAAEITSEAYHGGYDVTEFLSRSESKLLKVSEQRETKKTRPIIELVDEYIVEMDYKRQEHTAAIGVSSGYDNLDHYTGGFRPSRLYIIGGRPGQGKTALALNLTMNFARAQKHTLFASLEMSGDELTGRAISLETGLESSRIQNPKWLSGWDMQKVHEARERFAALPLFIDDKAHMTLIELRAKCKTLQSQGQLDVVIVDYLQIMSPADKRIPREQQIAGVSNGLKTLAKDLHIPVISLAQLSRESDKRAGGDKRPQMSDLRESGQIEQDADLVMFLYRPEYYKKGPKTETDPTQKGLMEAIIAKNRHGAVGTAYMKFTPETTGVSVWDGPEPAV